MLTCLHVMVIKIMHTAIFPHMFNSNKHAVATANYASYPGTTS